MSRIAILVTTVAVAALSTACTSSGTGESGDPTSGGSTPSGAASSTATAPPQAVGPDCADVWQAGQTLPADYTECAAGAELGPQDVTDCDDDTRLVVFDDVLWAVTGGKVVEPDASPVQDTEEYGAAYAACTGE